MRKNELQELHLAAPLNNLIAATFNSTITGIPVKKISIKIISNYILCKREQIKRNIAKNILF